MFDFTKKERKFYASFDKEQTYYSLASFKLLFLLLLWLEAIWRLSVKDDGTRVETKKKKKKAQFEKKMPLDSMIC